MKKIYSFGPMDYVVFFIREDGIKELLTIDYMDISDYDNVVYIKLARPNAYDSTGSSNTPVKGEN